MLKTGKKLRLKELRIFKQMTQKEISDILGVSQPVLSDYEKKGAIPSNHYRTLCKHFTTELVQKYSGDNPEPKEPKRAGLCAGVHIDERLKELEEVYKEKVDLMQKIIDQQKSEIEFLRGLINGGKITP